MLATDPACLALDDDGDVVVPLRWLRGVEAVAQGVRQRLLLFRGEWFLNLLAGIPYYQELLGKKFDRARAQAIFRDAILATPGVDSLVSMSVEFVGRTRTLTVTWSARTAFGDTPVDTLAIGGN